MKCFTVRTAKPKSHMSITTGMLSRIPISTGTGAIKIIKSHLKKFIIIG